METWLATSAWPTVVLWVILYIRNYYLTLYYQVSAFEFYLSSIPFLIIAALTYSLFFVGGAIICFGTGFKHSRLAKKAKSNLPQAVAAQT